MASATTPTRAASGPAYRLVRPPVPPVVAPLLDAAQQAVVDHRGGPLLVLAGPGTGKTTTLVEAVVDRVQRGGPDGTPLDPGRVLVLTFSRRAAAELRTRITARLARTTTDAVAWTFHGFCYALLRRFQTPEQFGDPLRLLSGPEQHAVVRELLAGSVELGTAAWPDDLRGLLDRRGFVEEVRRLLARVRQLGLNPADLAVLADAEGRPEWAAAAVFGEEYLDVLELRGVLDYGELVRAAAALAGEPDVQAHLRATYDVVLVDEYQDTDPAQEALLRHVAGDGRDLVVVGDPDQSIYAFRGADVSNILQFPDRFRTVAGEPAPVHVLRTSRRAGPGLLAASRAIARHMSLAGLPVDRVRAHRALVPVEDDGGAVGAAGQPAAPVSLAGRQLSLLDADGGAAPAPEVHDAADPHDALVADDRDDAWEVRMFTTPGGEIDGIADILRRAHLEDGVPWTDMAVLVRSGTRSIPTLRRGLATAGVPVEVAGDEVPLAAEPAVRTLLLALSAAVDPAAISAEAARDLLASPLVRTRPATLRRLARALRAADRGRVGAGGTVARPSGELLRLAVADPASVADLDAAALAPVRALRAVLDAGHATVRAGGTVDEVLWTVWTATDWPDRLARASHAGGTSGRRADADLDAVVALFDVAGRAEERLGQVGVGDFVEQVRAQQIPADTLAERAPTDDAVRVLTAHRAKGLEWELVVVAGVTEDVWPDVRRRDGLLAPDRLGRAPDGRPEAVPPPSRATLVAEERRLFYVAITRARRRLVVTAVASGDEGGGRPSRFLAELGRPLPEPVGGPPRRLALHDLVAELRAYATDLTNPLALREAAASRLARLAGAQAADGRRLVPAAHPDAWWGLAEPSDPGRPMRRDDEPIRLSGSSLERLATCPLQWFLDREVRASSGAGAAAGFGSLVHALADAVTAGRLAPSIEAIGAQLDRVWPRLELEVPWHSARERAEARAALERFLAWHAAERGRTVVGSERDVDLTLEVAGRPVRLRGRIDRVEVDADGDIWVIDLKTTKTPRTQARVDTDAQLAIYQVAVREGALRDLPGARPDARPAGGELVYLRAAAGRARTSSSGTASQGPKVMTQPALDPEHPHPAEVALESAVQRIAAEQFPAVVGPQCNTCQFTRSCPADPRGRQVVS